MILPFALLFLFSTIAAAAEVEEPFADEIHYFGVVDEIYSPLPCATLFVGSSSIKFWDNLAADFPKMRVIRRGYGGSTIADTNYYFDRIVTRYQPKKIVFYAGENDINGGIAPDSVFSEFRNFMEKKTQALGATPVYFVSIKPSIARINNFNAQSQTNGLIAEYAKARADLVYVDIVSAMIDNGRPKEIFISDNLHMNAKGYSIWKKEIGKALKAAKASKSPICPG